MSAPRELFPVPSALVAADDFPGLHSSTRRRRAAARQRFGVCKWAAEAAHALNWLYGREVPDSFGRLSLAQEAGLEQMNARIGSLGGPPCTPAAALRELCRSTPGYDCDPVKSIVYTEGRVSLPSDPGKCDALAWLRGHPSELRHGWRQRLLRDPGALREPVVPYFDDKLRRSPGLYAKFLSEMHSAGMIRFAPARKASVGLFFVEKSGDQLRLILDTRRINQEFIDPESKAPPFGWRAARASGATGLDLVPAAGRHRGGLLPGAHARGLGRDVLAPPGSLRGAARGRLRP